MNERTRTFPFDLQADFLNSKIMISSAILGAQFITGKLFNKIIVEK
jgi:hypothetical protein